MRHSMIHSGIRRRLGTALGALTALLVTAAAWAGPGEATPLNQIETPEFVIQVGDVEMKTGGEAAIVITIQAKADYKVNQDYPHKIKMAAPPAGVNFPKPELRKGDGSFSGKQQFTFKVPVKTTRAGDYKVSGKLKFSVCNDANCLLKKQDVTARVRSK